MPRLRIFERRSRHILKILSLPSFARFGFRRVCWSNNLYKCCMLTQLYPASCRAPSRRAASHVHSAEASYAAHVLRPISLLNELLLSPNDLVICLSEPGFAGRSCIHRL